jgi:hypothetical protein
MSVSNVFIISGLLLTLIGCFIEIIGMLSVKDKKLYSSILMSGFLEQNIVDGFTFKYRQIEGFLFIIIGTFFQIIPNVFVINFEIKPCVFAGIILAIILLSFFTDMLVVNFSKTRHDRELARRIKK